MCYFVYHIVAKLPQYVSATLWRKRLSDSGDSLAQATLKSQRLSGANSYKKIVLNIMTVLHTVIIYKELLNIRI